jgi:hypothetical protein
LAASPRQVGPVGGEAGDEPPAEKDVDPVEVTDQPV